MNMANYCNPAAFIGTAPNGKTNSANNVKTVETAKTTDDKSQKFKIGLASLAGAGAGLGTGGLCARQLGQKTVDNFTTARVNGCGKKFVDSIGNLIVKDLKGGVIPDCQEKSMFFNHKLRPQGTVEMEEFIKNNNLSIKDDSKKIKNLFREYVSKNEPMQKRIGELENSIKYGNVETIDQSTSVFKKLDSMRKSSKSLIARMQADKTLKQCGAIIAGSVAAGAVIAGVITAGILKHKNESNSSQIQ